MRKVLTRPYPDLATWRATQGINQREAAKRLQMTQSHYSKLERRTHATSGHRARRIMDLTGVPLEILVWTAR